jgi:hypothetical protein
LNSIRGNRGFYTAGTIQTYNPAAGIFAGASVGAATGVGIHQIDRAAGYQEQAAQGIFQHTTIHPGATVVGQVELKPHTDRFSVVNVDVPVNGFPTELQFQRKDSPQAACRRGREQARRSASASTIIS